MIKTTRYAALAGSSIISICLAAPLAMAQDEPAQETEARQQTVIVSATRREESIQDVPVSATAFNAEDIKALRLQSTADIGDQAPNIILVQGNFGYGAPIISVRGVTNGDFSATSNTPVTVYSDDVPLTQIVSHGFGLYDLERIELLRGPQGTLFGRNATSGALQFVSAGPTDAFEAGGSVTMARYD
ncbi:MAG: Plug domain-containing protein, partial [Pseudomonadota bacterium]|nr:Plug domain-containing protein [Pseudomonadota bacterium]